MVRLTHLGLHPSVHEPLVFNINLGGQIAENDQNEAGGSRLIGRRMPRLWAGVLNPGGSPACGQGLNLGGGAAYYSKRSIKTRSRALNMRGSAECSLNTVAILVSGLSNPGAYMCWEEGTSVILAHDEPIVFSTSRNDWIFIIRVGGTSAARSGAQ